MWRIVEGLSKTMKMSVILAVLRADFRTQDLLNTTQNRYVRSDCPWHEWDTPRGSNNYVTWCTGRTQHPDRGTSPQSPACSVRGSALGSGTERSQSSRSIHWQRLSTMKTRLEWTAAIPTITVGCWLHRICWGDIDKFWSKLVRAYYTMGTSYC